MVAFCHSYSSCSSVSGKAVDAAIAVSSSGFVVFSMRLAFLFSFKFVVRKNNTKNTIRMQNFCKLLCVVALFSLLAGQSRAPNRQYRI